MADIKSVFRRREKTPTPEQMRSAVESFTRALSACDTQAILSHFAPDATQSEPTGRSAHRGHDEIASFFQKAFDAFNGHGGLYFRTEGRIRIAGRVAVANMIADWTAAERPFRIYSTDVFTFDEQGLITNMTAYWGETDIEYLAQIP